MRVIGCAALKPRRPGVSRRNSFFACMNGNMQPKIHRSATTYGVQNSISDTLQSCHFHGSFVDERF